MRVTEQASSGPGLAKIVDGKLNEIHKESDGTRKEFRNGKLGTEEFVQKYVKGRQEYHEYEQVKRRLMVP